MAGKNITIAGAVFNAVPSIDVPISGGGTASFVEISDTTAQAADVASGKYFYTAAGVKTEGTASGGGGVDVEALSVTQNGTYTAPSGKAYSPVTVNVSGGGGASNVVTGTFTGTAGGAMNIDLPYTGSGFPTSVIIYPKEGAKNPSGTLGSTVWKGASSYWSAAKRDNNAPTYSGSADNNYADGYALYKSSTSNAASYSWSNIGYNIYQNSAAASTSTYSLCRIRSSTKLSVYISGAAGTNGFVKDIEYVYTVTYSS